ncbi:hypothetical protein [Haloarcula amylovorans]|uniref:hypothetical protein n=1 Tax=Haloarcula amylovorans TaxID=2562280 RepID=UPI0010763731|nr:hypothetical protein [Halomicroarcula amylolytica]
MIRNRNGTPVDPVPFLVVSGLGVAVSFSFGPIYVMEFGASLPFSLSIAGLVALGTAAVAYHRYVWTARPELRSEIPADVRLGRLLYGMVVGFFFVVALALPLVAGGL